MKTTLRLIVSVLGLLPMTLVAQQQVTVISRCGGLDTVVIPTIVDNDHDGMDDALEQRLLDYFMPAIIQFSGESCPGPALDGTGDSNLIACHIYPIPQQYQLTNNLSAVSTHPVPVVAARALTPGLIWYNPLIKVNVAVLYGQDCGLLGHTADVEGFNFSLKYTGPDTLAGWMYDTVMQHWAGGVIQSVSHAGTLCEQVETLPYQSTVYASPDKHGNYLTISQCGASIICNPGCSGTQHRQPVKNVNLGEPNAPLVTDLGTIYAPYSGENPWGNTNFLDSHGGNAGLISDKMVLDLTSDFVGYQTLTQPQICPLYLNCYGQTGSAYLHYACNGSTYGFYSQNLTTAGTYQQTLTNSYGCDSIITLTLGFVNADTTSLTAAICNGSSYAFDGQQLTAAGVYPQLLTNANGCDSLIILTLTVNPLDTTSIHANICAGNSYGFGGQQLTTAGVYQQTLPNTNGCDSTVILTLTVGATDTTLITASICTGNSYGFDGQQLTTAGTYQQTLVSTYGCDSTIILALTVNPLDTTPVNASICIGSSYTFNGQQLTVAGIYQQTLPNINGCDSTVILTLTVNPVQNDTVLHSICQGEAYQGHTIPGAYIDTLLSIAGCDSLVTTILTVDPLPATPIITQSSDTLSTDTTGITTYQWYMDTTLIISADSNRYIVMADGYYHVVVTNAFGCAATSDSILVTLVGIAESDVLTGIYITPNPTDGKLIISLPNTLSGQTFYIELLNVLGERVLTPITTNILHPALELQSLPKGIYLLRVSGAGQLWTGKVVKE